MQNSTIAFIRRSVILVALAIVSAVPAHGQKSGALKPIPMPPDVAAAAMTSAGLRSDSIYGRVLSDDRQETFRRLLVDPSLTSSLRTSAWAAGLTAGTGADEVKFQANVCDMGLNCQRAFNSAVSLTFTAPVNEDGDPTELADLDGLLGTARATGNWTLNATKVGGRWPALSFKGTYARPEFAYTYVTGTTLSADTSRRAGFSLAAGPSWKGSNWALLFQGKYEDKYEASDEAITCDPVPPGPTPLLKCTTSRLGAPAQALKTVLSGEFRRAFGGAAAISLIVSREMREGVTGIDVPIWLVPSEDGKKLTAGIRGGYKTDTKKFGASIFVGAFDLW